MKSTNDDLCLECEESLPWLKHACYRCGLPFPKDTKISVLCGQCQSSPPVFDICISPFVYEHPIDQLISHYKFFGKLYAGRFLSQQLANFLQEHYISWPELIIPVPLHPKGMRERGFNQALEIARDLSFILKLKINSNLCFCVKQKTSQKKLSAAQRKKNLEHSFAIEDPKQLLKGKNVALVDDVVTTMSTVNTLSKLLLKAGASSVQVWCLARTDRH